MKMNSCFVGALLLTCTSCSNGGKSKERLYPVSGRVTYNGSPAAGAIVSFHRHSATDRESAAMGVVQKDGSFELVSGALGKGTPPGDYDVLVEWTRYTGAANRRPQTGRDLLQGRYGDPRRPLLHAKVEAEENQLSPFNLTAGSTVPNG